MGLFQRLRQSFAAPAPEAVSRRRFVAGAGLAAGALLAPNAYAAARLDIEPGTLVDAQGRPLGRAAMAAEPFVGEIMIFAGNFAPQGWAFCNGQFLSINQNQALFSILFNTYGGDGTSTFALPDLRGRFPTHSGNSTGPGLTQRVRGERGGQENVALTAPEMPQHLHTVPQVLVRGAGTQTVGVTTGSSQGTASTWVTGNGQAHNNMPPYLGLNFCIALQGIYPSQG